MPLTFTPLQTGKFVARASLVLRTLEGTELNPLDILIRESIQNSLDAAAEQNSSVEVDFSIKNRPKDAVCSIFDQDAERHINKKFADVPHCQVLTIRDTGTTGLTGDFEDENSKIYKLIADIGRAQENAGSGGSWGLGKTIYYHMGTNIVGFYSQSRNSKNKVVSSLSFGYIEDEKNSNRLISQTPSGIAWWGGKGGAPIKNRTTILPILKKFGISPFEKAETGTCIIIPFFAQTENRLKNDDAVNCLPWECNEAEYIKLAIQRWYSNRLIETRGKPILHASVNGVDVNQVAPIFKVIQSLRKLTDNFKGHESIKKNGGLKLIPCAEEKLEWKIDEGDNSTPNTVLKAIYLKKAFQNEDQSNKPPAGWIAARRLTESELSMLRPNNLPSPHKYIFGSSAVRDEQLPIVAMSRSPQMIVAYDTNSWRAGLKLDAKGEYLIALFVLNSNARLLDGTRLEEYIRSIENSTHTDWRDSIVGSKNKEIPEKIKSGVVRALRNAFFNDVAVIEDLPQGEHIRAQLGKALLPSDFGTTGMSPPPINKGKGEPQPTSSRQSQPSMNIDATQYTQNTIKLCLTIFNANNSNLKITIEADAGSGKTMTRAAWNDEIKSPEFPFILEAFNITRIRTIKGKGKISAFSAVKPTDVEYSTDNVSSSLKLKEGLCQQFQADLILKTSDRSVNPVIKLATTEVSK
jgi:hypothetical protein